VSKNFLFDFVTVLSLWYCFLYFINIHKAYLQ
jgi:hypothetical protein